jgi:hypothetical protein
MTFTCHRPKLGQTADNSATVLVNATPLSHASESFCCLYIVNVVHQPATTARFLLSAAGIGNLFVGYVSSVLVRDLQRLPSAEVHPP